MPNSYYNHGSYPSPNSPGSSAQLRAELELITSGFAKLPTLSGNAYQVAMVNSAGTALVASSALQALAITSSTIDSTPIGATTRAAGNFTTLSANGAANIGTNVTIGGGVIDNTIIGGTTRAAGYFTTVAANSGFTGNLTGNVTGNLTGNVTGNVTGNLTGNVTAASGTSTFNNVTISGSLDMDAGSSATIINLTTPTNSGDAANKGYVDTQVATKLSTAGGTMSGAIAMGTNRITGLGDPSSAQDAATKNYVDSVAQGLDPKASVRVASTGNLTLSGTQTIDGVSVVAGDRVLVKNQSTAANNGIYVVAVGSWSRSADMDAWTEFPGAFFFVEEGTTNDNSGWVCTVSTSGTLGVTAVTFEQFSGAGQVIAGAGLTKTGNTLDVGTASSTRIVVNADNIDLATTGVTASTYKSVTVDIYGRVTAGTNPTTLSGYGISDAYTKTQIDTTVAGLLALTGGTMSGAIAMGTNRITGLGDPSSAQDAATKNYIDTLFGSTTSAAASASAAATSATAAASSATAAAGSASAASTSAANAAASYDAFDDRYLGSKTSDPTVDNDGNPLLEGALYWNSTAKIMKAYDGSAWLASYIPATGYLQLSGGTLTGALALAVGSVTAPGLAFSGDANTGLYWVSDNIFAATTGGTEAWRVLSNQHLLLGDTTDRASATLQVTGLGLFRGAGNGTVYLEDTTVGDTSAPFYYTQSASGLLVFGKANRSGVNTTGSTSLGTVNAAGTWSLGTAGTAVITNDTNRGRIDLYEGTNKLKSFMLINGNGSGSIGMRSNEPLNLFTNDTVRFVIGAAGQLGIGASPSYGTAGQALLSQGSGAAPVWGSAGLSLADVQAAALCF